jgi:PhnB protein
MNEPARSDHSGGCLCGAVRYEARGPASDLAFCHCNSCTRATGVPAVPWGTFQRSSFAITRGELREFGSSPGVVRGFCSACGTSLTYRHAARPQEIDVTLATLDAPEALRPEAHLWVDDKPSWVAIGDGLPQFERARMSPSTTPARVVRPGYGTVSPRIVVEGMAGLVEFIRKVFGADGEPAPGLPAELRLGDSTIMVSEAGARACVSAFLYVYVGDVEGTYQRALELGARSLEAPADLPYGDRRCMIADAWGNTWQIARYLRPAHAR